MKRLRMVLGGPRGGLGGAQRIVECLERRFEREGWTVEWFGPAQLASIPQSHRFPGLNEALRTLAVRSALRKMPRAELTISHGTYGLGTPGRRVHVFHGTFPGLARACRARLHPLDLLVLRWINGTLEQLSGAGSRRVVVSQQVKREIRAYFGLGTHDCIHNAVDTHHLQPLSDNPHLRSQFHLPAERKLILTVGRMDYGKGLESVREMLSHLPADSHLVLAVPPGGDYARLQALPNTTVVPGVPYEQLPALYSACDLLLCPSRYEGFGLTLAEAWACRRPVVTARVGIVPELEGQEVTFDAAVREVGDGRGLADAIAGLLGDRLAAERQAVWGQSLVQERFGIERFERCYLSTVDAALG